MALGSWGADPGDLRGWGKMPIFWMARGRAGGVVMAGEPVVVGLLYRADWTRLSLAAVTADGSRVLLAPGRRYRYESGDYVTGCDGIRPWEMPGGDEDDACGEVHWVSGPQSPLPELLCPAWLLVGSRLRVRGRVQACGRDAWDVLMTRRSGTGRAVTELPGRVEAVVDAELGIVLSLVRDAEEPEPVVTELVSLDLDVVIDPARFAPPPGSRLGESLGEALGGGGAAGRAARVVAGVAAGGLGAWIRHSRSGREPPAAGGGEDGEAGMPPSDPAPQITADGVLAGPPVSDELLSRLHEGGAGHFTAAVHQWIDVGAMASQIPEGARRAGFGGLADAVSEQHATAHLVSAVGFGGPGQYQIDHANAPRRGPKTIACDGQRRWQVRDAAATVGPAGPAPKEFADLADPSWLLQCRLSGGEPVTVGGRPGYRLSAARGARGWLSMMFPAAVAVLDTELGIVRRLTFYIGGKPVRQYELRDITASDEEFQAEVPPGLTVTEESSPLSDFPDGWPGPPNLPLAIATAIGRQAAAEAGKAARTLLNRFQGRQPDDGE
jgi:hypothetical protein